MAGLISVLLINCTKVFLDYSLEIIYPMEGNKQDNLLSTYYFPDMLSDFYTS